MTEEIPSRFEPLWTIDETAEYLMMSKQTLYGWRCRDTVRRATASATSCATARGTGLGGPPGVTGDH